jgi:uncharacterized protein (TIGR03067 family)/prepilin-type processing-associated H-X9-DG protein
MRKSQAGLAAVVAIIVGAVELLDAQDTPPIKSDQERILGSWRISSARGDGNDMPTDLRELARVAFSKDGKALLTFGGQGKDEGKYKFAGPGQIDLNLGDKGAKALSPGIYKFEGDDRLLLCMKDNPQGATRPTEFNGDNGSGQILFVLDRTKTGEEKPTAQELDKHKELADNIREVPARTQSINNLSQVGRAMYFYYDSHKHLPLHAIYSKDGKTALLSWRVAILPHINEEALYREFKLDEPWDSPHNKELVPLMPKAYEPVGLGKQETGLTYYQVFTGPDTVFDGTKKLAFNDIKDGLFDTILVVEAREPVIWTKPADLIMPQDKNKMPAVGGMFNDRAHVLFCDAHVAYVSRNIAPAFLRALVTPNGGERTEGDPAKQKK